jgi:P27 family predicted phage terminase small subunit
VIIDCPPELSPAAKQEWDRIISELTATDMLKIFDRAALAAYCEAYALWIEAVENVHKYGAVMKSPSGFPLQSPYLSIAARQVDTMLRIATEFGFTPASRGQRSMITKVGPKLLEADAERALGSELSPLCESDLPEKW